MSDEFETVNVRGEDRAREIDVLRQHYTRHRDALHRMIADAPTELLAGEYRRVSEEIERSLAKLGEIEGAPPHVPALPVGVPQVASPARPSTADLAPPAGDAFRSPSQAGMRTLQPTPGIDPQDARRDPPPVDDDGGGSRLLLILGTAVVALALIGWLIWRSSSDRAATPALVDTAPPPAIETLDPVAAPAVEAGITISPASHDYGTIRKGTRATRRFEITNSTDEPVSVQLARSACRCLYYDHSETIPPKAKESVTVTVDGAKAKAGALKESIAVTSKTHPSITGTLEVLAAVKP